MLKFTEETYEKFTFMIRTSNTDSSSSPTTWSPTAVKRATTVLNACVNCFLKLKQFSTVMVIMSALENVTPLTVGVQLSPSTVTEIIDGFR